VRTPFANDWLLASSLPFGPMRAECGSPAKECGDGQRYDWGTDTCTACIDGQCGQGCLCPVGSTCASGGCVDLAMGRVASVAVVDATAGQCMFAKGDLIPSGSIRDFVPGEQYDVAGFDGCSYGVKAEALSR
jgi:hypothetical protein